MTFKDYFSKQSKEYARFRPSYPNNLFDYLSSLCENHQTAWDCGTGNGQVALSLAGYFDKVYASDASESQIANAVKDTRIEYFVSKAESTPLASQSIDLITVAQAFHWFDAESFYQEVKRVLKPKGILALWCYGWFEIPQATPQLEIALAKYYEMVEPFWPPERQTVESKYETIYFPFTDILTPSFSMSLSWGADSVIGYLSTWSATQRCIAELGEEKVLEAMEGIATSYGPQPLNIEWPIYLRAGHL